MSRKIIITGGAGYIGSHVVLEALEEQYDVTIFDDLSSPIQANINSKAKFIKGSIQSKKDLSALFRNDSYDGVIHLAASKTAGESMLNPIKYAENNVVGSLNLINQCIQHNVKVFIFSSSAAVYGKPRINPINESHPKKPVNYYGFTKLTIENHLRWYSLLCSLNFGILRYFNAAGYDIKKRIYGTEKNTGNLIPRIMEVAVGEKPFITVYGKTYNTRDGSAVRDYVHVSDLAKAHIKAYDYVFKRKKDLILNLGSETGFSVFEVLQTVREITNADIKYKIGEPRDGDVDKIIASCDLAKQLIGYNNTNSSLETIIKTAWGVYKTKR